MEQSPRFGWPFFDDITSEILLRLPAKSVGRFRCVSRRWLSLTIDPQFIKAHSSFSQIPASSFYLCKDHKQAELFHLDGSESPPDPTISFVNYKGYPAEIVHSCNGFLLCCMPIYKIEHGKPILLSVCNPATREHDVIPVPRYLQNCKFSLAFDPSLSPSFKVFALKRCQERENHYFSMHRFSSETRAWKLIHGDLPTDLFYFCYPESIFWKGSLYWLSTDSLLCLDVVTERFNSLMLPSQLVGTATEAATFNQSGGRLHCFAATSAVPPRSRYRNSHFDVFEMDSESSKWSLLHRVDLDDIVDVYIEADGDRHLEMDVLWFHRGERDGVGDCLLLSLPTKIVAYHLTDASFSTICDNYDRCSPRDIYPHANTLFSLNASSTYGDWVCWKSEHDKLLISLMVEHCSSVQKSRVRFEKDVWNDMVEKFNGATHMNYEIHHLLNRYTSYLREYQAVRRILSSPSFDWDPIRQMVSASDIDWSEYLKKSKLRTFLYKRKRVPLRDLRIICSPAGTSYREDSFVEIKEVESSEREGADKDNENEFSKDTQRTLPLKRKEVGESSKQYSKQ